MMLEEGGGGIEDTILFGKYQICRVLGTGGSGTVFLAVHLGLEEYRAVKRVAKTNRQYERFREEGLILKELRHPGIPIVYDLEEDEEYSYLIEEYLEGESLYDLVNRLGHVSETRLIRYGIQICHLVNHLHSAGNHPILHLDLQPKNLLLCNETVRLIDFDHAAPVDAANLSRKRYGTVGCAAPEQYNGDPLDQRTDIYAIGVILYYMGNGAYPEKGWESSPEARAGGLNAVIARCLELRKEKRYQGAEDVCRELERLRIGRTGVFKNKQSSLKIAMTGSKSGVGTTHISIGLSVYLKNHGFPNIYEERNLSGAVQELKSYYRASPDPAGLIWIRDCALKPHYGECVRIDEIPPQILVQDYGTDWYAARDEEGVDLILLISGGKWWELSACLKAARALDRPAAVRMILPRGWEKTNVRLPAELRKYPCYQAPYFPDPFGVDDRTGRFYEAVMKELLHRRGGGLPCGPRERVRDIWKRITGP